MKTKFQILYFKVFLMIQRFLFLRFHEKSPGFYVFNKEKKISSIIFDLSNSRYTHIGDSLFYEPIINKIKKNGCEIDVCVNKNIRKYYETVGHKITDEKNIDDYDLIIAPFWLFNLYSKQKKNKSIFLDPSNFKIDQPITNYFYFLICNFLKISSNDTSDLTPTIPLFKTKKFNLVKNQKYIIYNDSIDSGFLGITKEMRKSLESFANRHYKMGYKIIRIASIKDMRKNPEILEFDHLDLRGKTEIIDMFQLIEHPDVVGTISFDTAVAHIAIMYKKKVNIMLRRFTKNHQLHIKNFIMPSYFSNQRSKIKYIEK